jgi:uncharacterized repeat protein (TIGR04052 family)
MRFLMLALAGLSFATAACGDDDGTSSSTTTSISSSSSSAGSTSTGTGGSGGGSTMAVEIPFTAKVGSQAFDCAESYDALGTSEATASITDFRFYVHDVALVDQAQSRVPVELEQDGLWQYENVALLDFEDKTGACSNGTTETRTVVRGVVPQGSYVGLSFKLGVPNALNHLDNASAPSPLNLTALFWTWSSGYKYLRVDSVAMGAAGPFNLHLGATGCVGDPAMGDDVTCANPNVAEVELAFDLASDTVVADYAEAVAEADLLVDGGGAPGCMSGGADPECAAVFPALGLDLTSGDPAPQTLTFFRVE